MTEKPDALSERYWRGNIDALEIFWDVMATANCGCNFDDAIDLLDDVIAEQIHKYEQTFGTWVATETIAEVEQ